MNHKYEDSIEEELQAAERLARVRGTMFSRPIYMEMRNKELTEEKTNEKTDVPQPQYSDHWVGSGYHWIAQNINKK